MKKNSIALITGGADGICFEVAMQLSALNQQVIIVDKNTDRIREVSERKIANLSAIECDIEHEENIKHLFKVLEQEQKLPTTLVNGVGGDARKISFAELTPNDLSQLLQQNLFTAFNMSQYAIPFMLKQGYGRIVNFASIAGRTYTVFSNTAYVCAKSAVIGLTKQMAYEYADKGITINTVAHGPIATKRIQTAWEQKNETEKNQILSHIPMGRLGELSEAASAVLHLCSKESGYMTGSTIDVNGGMYI